MKTKHTLPTREYCVAVTRGRKTRYFYGRRLKDALTAAGLKAGEVFTYTLMKRQSVTVAELTDHNTIRSYA